MKRLRPCHNFYIINQKIKLGWKYVVELMIIMVSPLSSTNVKLVYNKADPIRHKCYINGPNFKI